jgi:PIN domain nuclease of toxin-antitoxin system
MSGGLLLDTHVWIWLLLGEYKPNPRTFMQIEEAYEHHKLSISDITLWEISMLAKKERINLGQPTLSWIKNALKLSGTQLVHITPEIAVDSTEFLADFHGDPANRILVATARVLDLVLVTRDEKILEYGKTNRVFTLRF